MFLRPYILALLLFFFPMVSLGQVSLYVTPEDFGAVGDGIHDDTQAIQAAITSGRSIRFAPKVYRIEGTVTVSSPIDMDGNNCTIVGTGAPRRRVVFAIKSNNTTIHDFQGRFEQDSRYSGDQSVPGNNIILFSIFSDNVDIRRIRTDGVFSTVMLTDTDHRIKNNIRIQDITAKNGNMNIFLRYARNVAISNLDLSISTYCSEFHPIYVCSDVREVNIDNVKIYGEGARDLISVHPSSQMPDKYNIKKVYMSNITFSGSYQYALVFRFCQDIIVDGLTMTYDKALLDGTNDYCSVVEGYQINNIRLRNMDCQFLGNLSRITTPRRCKNSVNILFEDCNFEFNYTPSASHVLIQSACNTRFKNCQFSSTDSSPVTLIVGTERTQDTRFENCVFTPKTRGWLADMRGGRVVMKGVKLENKVDGINAVKSSAGELRCIDCSAVSITESFTDNKIKQSKRNRTEGFNQK